jgi:rhamnosyltransferase
MRRVAIFAHYDPQNSIKRYILHHLMALREVCDEVHFASTAQLSDEELAKLDGIVSSHISCENTGYDFGMWAQVIHKLDLKNLDELVLTNSSIIGPVNPLADAFERMRGTNCDFWGMCDSLAFDYHIQSFFFVFRASVLKSGQVERFFASVLPYHHKWQLIRSYELGLTQFFIDQGFVPAALATVYDRRLRCGSCNPSIRMPMRLLDNPARLRLGPIRAKIASLGFPVDLLELDHHPKDGIFFWLLNQVCLLLERWRMRRSPFTQPLRRSVPAESQVRLAAGETRPNASPGLGKGKQKQPSQKDEEVPGIDRRQHPLE